jgi:Porin subfamily
MQKNLLVLGILLPLASAAAAESSHPLKLDQSTSATSLPVKQPKSVGSCAAYGAGFVQLAGSDTCVKIGGAVSIGVGGNVGSGR